MTCLRCEVTRAKLLASVLMLGKPRTSQPAWDAVVSKLNREFGPHTHYLTEIEGEFWLIRMHPVTHTPIKLKKVA